MAEIIKEATAFREEQQQTFLGTKILSDLLSGKISLESLPRSERQLLEALLTPKMTQYIPSTPTPKQAAFLLLDDKEAFYGGAAGGGKSEALLMCGLQYVDIKGYAGIIFRKNFSDLTKPGALIDRAKDWLYRYDDVKWDEKNKKFNFFRKYGKHTEIYSTLQFGYMENENDKYNYQGKPFAALRSSCVIMAVIEAVIRYYVNVCKNGVQEDRRVKEIEEYVF